MLALTDEEREEVEAALKWFKESQRADKERARAALMQERIAEIHLAERIAGIRHEMITRGKVRHESNRV